MTNPTETARKIQANVFKPVHFILLPPFNGYSTLTTVPASSRHIRVAVFLKNRGHSALRHFFGPGIVTPDLEASPKINHRE
jgi:hypothetical protein